MKLREFCCYRLSTNLTFAEPTVKLVVRANMGIFKQLAEYLYLRKKDPDAPHTPWMKYMHGMNRLSIMIFLVALVIIIFKLLILPLFR